MEKIYLAVPPDETGANTFGLPAAHMAYRIAENGRLYRDNSAAGTTGGLMYLDDGGGFRSDPRLGGDIVRECAANRFTGVVFDVTEGVDIGPAASVCREKGLTVYVPTFFGHIPHSIVMIPTGITSSSLSAKLTEGLEKYGKSRVAMLIELRRIDCPFPAADGRELTAAELTAMMNRYRSPSFRSEELCANYFTYRVGGGHHIVIYDNAASIRSMLKLADRLGVGSAFMYYPHVKGILPEIIG